MEMTHGSLFSGIGGFDLASQWMGWDNKFHCEWNEFGQKVLKYYWPEAELFTDITKSNFTKYANKIDILTGGFPCQPYSSAGKRLGKEDSRHLWPEMLRAIREIQPRWVVGENVRGLTNWNGGMVFDEVQSDLEAEGYEVLPFLLPAAAVNAPHRRDRIWFVAYSISASERTNKLRSVRCEDGEVNRERSQTIHNAIRSNGSKGIATDSNSNGLNECDSKYVEWQGKFGNFAYTSNERLERMRGEKGGFTELHNRRNENKYWENFPTISPVCIGDDGLSDRLDNITFPKWRNESIKAGGNAIVPQVVYQIFKAIEQYELILQDA
jgi:DNA (cytosine-5)-methyltransferase 1